MALAKTQANFDAESEYKAIEQTLIESPRGRWFLSEHGRRARRLDTLTLHDAVAKLQESLREPPALLGQLRNEIESLQSLLHETRDAIAKNQPKAAVEVPAAGSETATDASGGATSAGHILSVAESIHALAWDLQSQDLNVDACEQIAKQASQMYALSHRHAVESERVRALTDALDSALLRLDGLLETVAHEAQFDSINPPSRPFDPDTASESATDDDVPPTDTDDLATSATDDVDTREATLPELPVQPVAASDANDGEMDAFDLALAKARAQETGNEPA